MRNAQQEIGLLTHLCQNLVGVSSASTQFSEYVFLPLQAMLNKYFIFYQFPFELETYNLSVTLVRTLSKHTSLYAALCREAQQNNVIIKRNNIADSKNPSHSTVRSQRAAVCYVSCILAANASQRGSSGTRFLFSGGKKVFAHQQLI